MNCYRCRLIAVGRGLCRSHLHLVLHYINRVKLMKLLGGIKCVECNCCDMRCLQFHHVDNDGIEDRKNRGAGYKFTAYYIRNPELAKKKLQVMCANHNQIHMKLDRKKNQIL